jgi:acyl-coenzyme A synthetase/AMP-(fatty) acid ligase
MYTPLTAKRTYYMVRPEGDSEAGEWRRIHNEELYILYTSPNIIRVIKSEGMRLTGCVAHVADVKSAYTWKIYA